MHFAFRGLIRDADGFLEKEGLTRVHHRILFAVRRSDELTVSGLCGLLGVSKQALHRPMKLLLARGLLKLRRHPTSPKFKVLALTDDGAKIEEGATGCERAAVASALAKVGRSGQAAWFKVMSELASMA